MNYKGPVVMYKQVYIKHNLPKMNNKYVRNNFKKDEKLNIE